MRAKRTVLKSFIIFVFSFLLLSCEDDLSFAGTKDNDMSVRKINLSELKHRPKAYEKMLEYMSDSSNKARKNIYNGKYEFTIDTDNIIYIEKEDYHSYTFTIYSDPGNDKGYTENLFLHLLPDGSYKAFLIQYNFDKEDLMQMKKGNAMPDLNVKTVFYPLPDFDSDSVLQARGCLQSMSVSCTYQVTVDKVPIPVEEGDNVGCDEPECLYDYIYSYTLVGCNYSSTSCGGMEATGSIHDMFSGGSGGGGNGGGGNGGVRNGPIIGISVSNDSGHIRELNKISNRVPGVPNPLRERIDVLASEVGTALQEKGMEVRRGPNGTYVHVLPFQSGFDYVSFGPPSITTVLYLHIHHNGTIQEEGQDVGIEPVPSDGDFFGFARAYDFLSEMDAPDKDNFTSIIISRNGLYAMRVEDPQKVIDLSVNIPNDKKMQEALGGKFEENVTEKGRIEAKKLCNGCSPTALKALTDIEVEKAFIDHIKYFNKDFGSGIKVFKGVLDSGSGNYIWTKIID